jgi:GH15 family glucan-1,4-alpha-glucosidase
MSFPPIENHGVIGNMRSIALVGMDGAIDFLCYPNFDSPSVFAALLDDERGGCFKIQPEMKDTKVRQLYLPQTNILLTRFLSEEGVAELTDYMPLGAKPPRTKSAGKVESQPNEIIRTITVVKGAVRFKMLCQPRFDYGRSGHNVQIENNAAIFTPENQACPPMALYSTTALHQNSQDVVGEFTLKVGESVTFIFGCVRAAEQPPELERTHARFLETTRFWRRWMAKSRYKGRWREIVNRSALMLKLLISQEHGSIVAAPTFSLPEKIGGVRNWDYRYTWLRDGAFTMYALIRLGFVEESEAFIHWIEGRLRDDAQRGPLQVVYGIDGEQKLDEFTLENLKGYKDSKPVRIGNAAYQQLQLDIYGETLDSVYLSNKYGNSISNAGWQDVRRVLDWLGKNWQRPDDGIWEIRGGEREFLHSRLMCWVAFDRALRLSLKRSLAGPLDVWRRTRDAIREDIFTNFWNDELKSFVQSKGSSDVDASTLLMPMMRFISPVDPMWQSTMKEIEKRLVQDAFVYRYDSNGTRIDGLPGGEGSFTACSFWYIECLARAGELEKAQLLFEKMLGYANHLGLYSEQLGLSGQHLGNFPQALTHLAMVSAATYLDRELSGPKDETWR